MTLCKDDALERDWGTGTASGTVLETLTRKVTRTLKGSEITRNCSGYYPALLVQQDRSPEVLKSPSEVRGA